MEDFNLEAVTMINAEVVYGMRDCYNTESKILYAYTLLNTYADSNLQQLYADAIKKHLSEKDFAKVVAETSYGKFDNLTFWVDKTIKDIEDYCMYANGYEKKCFMEDAVKGAFCSFVYLAVYYSYEATMELLEAVKKSDILQFLVPIAFYKQLELEPVVDPDDTKSEDEKYLDLLELEFSPYSLLNAWKSGDEEEGARSCALAQKKRRRETPEIIATQLSFLHLIQK